MNPSDPNYNASYAANILPILTNAEVIAVNQDPGGQQAIRMSLASSQQIWEKKLANGSIVVGLLNTSSSAENITASWSDLGLNGAYPVRRPSGITTWDRSAVATRHGWTATGRPSSN